VKYLYRPLVVAAALCLSSCSKEEQKSVGLAERDISVKATPSSVILATTTSTVDSGLLDKLIPVFEKQTGIVVKTVAVGTGQALELGRRGEADVLLVHAPEAEEKFVAEGYGKNRRPMMHNDFIIVGPRSDPAGIGAGRDAPAALKAVAGAAATWISRGDNSGTHQKEMILWKEAGIEPRGKWYIESGQGMGETLRIAYERTAYTLADRGTFLASSNLDLKIYVEGDPNLLNPYSVIEVAHGRVNAEPAKKLADFFCASDTQRMIGEFTSGGHKLFVPDVPK
jgi:tungstate transport system substrate-binding protein